ncbi:MAG: hypothetical protein YHS30scaffold667_29 [Phage 65_10]|nr:MAG: hypothetical protein YHS30scaffold667_29 [Phage 65_10]
MRNPLDAVIGWINPAAGVRRAQQRKNLERAYEAASRKDPWRPRRAGASANADHQADASTLRAKSRSLRQNVAYINAGMNARTHHGVGTGITSQFTTPALQAAWLQFVDECDADGNTNLYGLQKLAWDTMDTDGEVLFRIRPRRPSDGFKIPFQLQAMEVDWLDTTRTRNPDNGNAVIEGIEYDLLGRKVNYWFWSQHPGDVTLRTAFKMESKPVPAEQVIHLFSCDRPGQGRGFPRMASIIARTRDFSLYEDAERARKNLETRLSVLASASVDGLEQPDKTPGDVADLGTLGSGGIISLPAGLNLTAVEPKPAAGYVETAKLELHLIAAGAGFTYEHATGDMSESNFTQGRMRTLAFRREIEQVQWITFIPGLLDRICREFVSYGALAGLWKAEVPWKVKHTTPRWEYIQPDQEVAADLKEIGSGLATISSKLRARGEDPEDVFTEWKKDRDRLVADGTWEDMLFLTRGNLPTAPAQPDPGAKP